MCGIAGVVNLSGNELGRDAVLGTRMAATLTHRGPDDVGEMSRGPVSFGFRRLSIIDLETGQQPMSNRAETVWVMFNGEIYNYIELRGKLQDSGYRFRTKSDTEVILYAYEHYGLDFVQHLRGMYAIALWDSVQQRLVLVRDRVGKKPLYYSVAGGQLAFASEVKGLTAWPYLNRSIDPAALDKYLALLYVPSPHSIFSGVHKLQAGHMLVADCFKGEFAIRRYWRVAAAPDYSKSFKYYSDGLQEILDEAVRIRLRSDVPVGAFLSGGIDSTIIVGLMTRHVTPVRTFSIGFADNRFDESGYARLVASAFGTNHEEEKVDSANVAPADLEKMVWFMDEPFGDSSFIPTYWVAAIARKHVTVALSGDGGDELFAGYSRYRHFQTLRRVGALPVFSRSFARSCSRLLGSVTAPIAPSIKERLRKAQKALELSMLEDDEQILALQTFFAASDRDQIYSNTWRQHLSDLRNRSEVNGRFEGVASTDLPLIKFLVSDVETGMIDDGLVKVDRASMACSLEVRSPFLDHHVIEFAMRIPPQYKIRGHSQKIILKDAFRGLIPKAIMQRGKQGFEVPFAGWFRKKSWRSLLIDTLSEDRLRRQGIFNPSTVVHLRDQILDDAEAHGASISAYQLRHRVWALLMFQMWHKQFVN